MPNGYSLDASSYITILISKNKPEMDSNLSNKYYIIYSYIIYFLCIIFYLHMSKKSSTFAPAKVENTNKSIN